MGIPCFTPYLDENKSQAKRFGSWFVQSIQVPHDNVDCVMYYIVCPDKQKMIYATDFEYIPVSFRKQNINIMLIECNHIKDMLDKDRANYSHSVRGHAELQTTLNIIKDNNSNALRNVILCHLSSINSNKVQMVDEVSKIVPRANVYVAKKGLTVDLSECPF